ncbi:MAG: exodeoxyribonuclease VII large subunit [Austwickia sp.]|nr:exodeoxyribonuclease VII large subunit [Austwickia sp.]
MARPRAPRAPPWRRRGPRSARPRRSHHALPGWPPHGGCARSVCAHTPGPDRAPPPSPRSPRPGPPPRSIHAEQPAAPSSHPSPTHLTKGTGSTPSAPGASAGDACLPDGRYRAGTAIPWNCQAQHRGHVTPRARHRRARRAGVTDSVPERAGDTSPENPWPVRLLSYKIGEYVERMPQLWVEGQVVQLTRRPGSTTCYLTLRDADVDMSLSVTISTYALDAMPVPLRDGARVVIQAKPTFWARRGSLHLDGRQIRPVGQGELLARIEHLKQLLAAEGLFASERKRRLPFLPRGVGLICGRASAAERDVIENAKRRWPGVTFTIRQVPVQGNDAVSAVCAALADLDADAGVDVIVLARGGGSFEDLLPFSNEAMIRAVASTITPVVTAIGHDVDTPLVDFAADVRASTPTDAAKLIVPDVAAERASLQEAQARITAAQTRRLLAPSQPWRTRGDAWRRPRTFISTRQKQAASAPTATGARATGSGPAPTGPRSLIPCAGCATRRRPGCGPRPPILAHLQGPAAVALTRQHFGAGVRDRLQDRRHGSPGPPGRRSWRIAAGASSRRRLRSSSRVLIPYRTPLRCPVNRAPATLCPKRKALTTGKRRARPGRAGRPRDE